MKRRDNERAVRVDGIGRGGFIKGGATLFSLAAAKSLWGIDAPSGRVRLAVMGCHENGRGFQLMQRALETPGCEIAVVCDVDARARAAAAAKVFALTGRKPDQDSDIRRVLERSDVDGLICATPDHWHAWAAVAAMKSGKAIYVEKPCSATAAELETLRRVQRETGAVFEMGSQRRSAAVTLDAMKEIKAGVIGEINFARCWYQNARKRLLPGKVTTAPEWLDWDLWQGPCAREAYRDNVVHYNWHWTKSWGTGECPNNATHFVDLARWAMGLDYPERTISSGGKLYHHDSPDWFWPDVQHVSWTFPGGKIITWEGQSAVKYPKPNDAWSGCYLLGTKGSVLFGPADATLFDEKGEEVRKWECATKGDASVTSLTNPTDVADQEHMLNFVTCVRDHNVNTSQPIDSSVKSTLLVHLGNIAWRTGEAVKTDPTTGRLCAGSPGREFWGRTYEKGWELI